MSAILRPLQLADDEMALRIDGKNVQPPASVFPVAVLLDNHLQPRTQRSNVPEQQLLQILPLAHPELSERHRVPSLKCPADHLEQRHVVIIEQNLARVQLVAAPGREWRLICVANSGLYVRDIDGSRAGHRAASMGMKVRWRADRACCDGAPRANGLASAR